jgi:hypothetical protein
MTAPVTALAPEVQLIERSLDALLAAAIAAKPPWPARYPNSRLIGEVLREQLAQTNDQRAAAELLDNPVGEMVRQGVTILGKRLHEIGGMTLMQDVLYRVAELGCSGSERDRRIGIMDHRWSGIGGWIA